MINPTTESWRTIPGHPNYQMSNQGRVRNAKHDKLVDPRISNYKAKTGVSYYIYVDATWGHLWTATRWYALVWPDLPMINFSDQWREAVIKFNDLPKRDKSVHRQNKIYTGRYCHCGCGRKTTDYYAPECRQRIRSQATGAEPVSVYKTAYGGW